MASGRVRARYNLAKDIRKSDNILKSSAQRAQEQNEAAADSSFWGRLGGAGLGALAGLALAPLTGGASLAVMSGLTAATIGAGIGSYTGSKKGERAAGGIDTTVESGGFGRDKVADMNKSLEDYKKGVNEDRLMNAASDAFSVYTAGGGLSANTGLQGGTSAFASSAAKVGQGGASSYSYLAQEQAKQLIGRGAKNYGKQKLGLDVYEAYIKDNK